MGADVLTTQGAMGLFSVKTTLRPGGNMKFPDGLDIKPGEIGWFSEVDPQRLSHHMSFRVIWIPWTPYIYILCVPI